MRFPLKWDNFLLVTRGGFFAAADNLFMASFLLCAVCARGRARLEKKLHFVELFISTFRKDFLSHPIPDGAKSSSQRVIFGWEKFT